MFRQASQCTLPQHTVCDLQARVQHEDNESMEVSPRRGDDHRGDTHFFGGVRDCGWVLVGRRLRRCYTNTHRGVVWVLDAGVRLRTVRGSHQSSVLLLLLGRKGYNSSRGDDGSACGARLIIRVRRSGQLLVQFG